jgi:hypothetical protein
MSNKEVEGLQKLAMAHGGSLSVNPHTGLPEAGLLASILPTVAGAVLAATGVGAPLAALMVAGADTAATGSWKQGLAAGLGAYGGAGIASGVAGVGANGANSAINTGAQQAVSNAAAQGATAPMGSLAEPATLTAPGTATSSITPMTGVETTPTTASTGIGATVTPAAPVTNTANIGSGLRSLTGQGDMPVGKAWSSLGHSVGKAGVMEAATPTLYAAQRQQEDSNAAAVKAAHPPVNMYYMRYRQGMQNPNAGAGQTPILGQGYDTIGQGTYQPPYKEGGSVKHYSLGGALKNMMDPMHMMSPVDTPLSKWLDTTTARNMSDHSYAAARFGATLDPALKDQTNADIAANQARTMQQMNLGPEQIYAMQYSPSNNGYSTTGEQTYQPSTAGLAGGGYAQHFANGGGANVGNMPPANALQAAMASPAQNNPNMGAPQGIQQANPQMAAYYQSLMQPPAQGQQPQVAPQQTDPSAWNSYLTNLNQSLIPANKTQGAAQTGTGITAGAGPSPAQNIPTTTPAAGGTTPAATPSAGNNNFTPASTANGYNPHALSYTAPNYTGYAGIASPATATQPGALNYNPATQSFGYAAGGLSALGHYSDGGQMLRGPGDGMSDSIPAVIHGGKPQEAALADNEFVVPADVVSHLGNGSSEAGARKLYSMMDRIRQARTGRKSQAPQVNADKYLPA